MRDGTAREERIAAVRSVVEQLRADPEPEVRWQGGELHESGFHTVPYTEWAPVVHEAFKVIYGYGMVPFDWPQWAEGARINEGLTPDTVHDLDFLTTLKLLSALVRQDRFTEGAWPAVFTSGRGLLLFGRWYDLELAGEPLPREVDPMPLSDED